MFISIANSIGFSKVNTDLPNRENTLSHNEKFSGLWNKEYCQKFKSTDVVTVQIGSISASIPVVQIYQPEPLTSNPTVTLVSSYTGNIDSSDDRYYFEFAIDFANYTDKTFQVKVLQDDDVYLSEYLRGIDLTTKLANGRMVRIDYQNSELPSDFMNFSIDYTTGIAFFFYVEGILGKPELQSEDEVFNNINQKVLLESQMYRGQLLQTNPLPQFLTEKIMAAGKHFYFSVNDLQFISDGTPKLEQKSSNLASLEWLLIQKDVLGFNTDNRQLTGGSVINMDGIVTKKNEEITSTWEFVVPKEYMLHEIFASHNSSSIADYILKVGTTVGGDEIIDADMGDIPLSGGVSPIPIMIHEQLSYSVDTTVYVTITGTGAIADVRAQLILNT